MGRKAGFNEGEKSKKGPGIAKKHKESLRPNGLKGNFYFSIFKAVIF